MAAILAVVPAAGAATLFVDDDCSPPSNGSTGDPYCTIQEAVDDANSTGDIVRVRPGTYAECVDAFSVPKALAIEAENTTDPSLTVIDGRGVCDVGLLPVVILSSGSALRGFTVLGGGDAGVVGFGSVAITRNVVRDSFGFAGGASYGYGGGISVYSAAEYYGSPVTVTIEDNTLENDEATIDGGGIYLLATGAPGAGTTSTIDGNTVLGNRSFGAGGGIAVRTDASVGGAVSVVISQNTIQGNTTSENVNYYYAYGYGGGVSAITSGDGAETIVVRDNLVGIDGTAPDPADGNLADANGGGISAWVLAFETADHEIRVRENTVVGNSAGVGGGGIEMFSQADVLTGTGRAAALVFANDLLSNQAGAVGGGLLAEMRSFSSTSRNPFDVVGNTFLTNLAPTSGGGAFLRVVADDLSDGDGSNAPPAPAIATMAFRHNTLEENWTGPSGGAGGGVTVTTQAIGQGVASLTAAFNTIVLNQGSGAAGIAVESETIAGEAGGNGTTFVDLSNSRIEGNTNGFGVGGTGLSGPGTLQLTVRSSTIANNTAGTIDPALGAVEVCMPAANAAERQFPDLNGDGLVDGVDLLRLATAFASGPSAVHYNPLADLNGDLVVDGDDLAAIGASFGDVCQ